MMIYKIDLSVLLTGVSDYTDIEVEEGAEFLTAQIQNDCICAWYRFPFGAMTKQLRRFWIAGTGHTAPHNADYIGTVQLHGGQLVLHVFVERLPT